MNKEKCECGGNLVFLEKDKDGIMIFECEDCEEPYFNERDL